MNAALASRDSYLISSAMANSAVLLVEQGRYEEAIDLLDDSQAAIAANPKLRDQWRRNMFAIYERWGNRLDEESMVDEAIAILEKGADLADLKNQRRETIRRIGSTA